MSEQHRAVLQTVFVYDTEDASAGRVLAKVRGRVDSKDESEHDHLMYKNSNSMRSRVTQLAPR